MELNLENNIITQKGIFYFVNKFDNLKKLEKLELNLSNNKFNQIGIEELLNYFEKLEKVKFVIILENLKINLKLNNNVKIIDVGFGENRIIDFYVDKLINKMWSKIKK